MDGSSFSAHALPAAHHFAKELGAGVLLPNVVPEENDVPTREAELAAVGPDGVEAFLEALVKPVQANGLQVPA